jgi:hypothetical protein
MKPQQNDENTTDQEEEKARNATFNVELLKELGRPFVVGNKEHAHECMSKVLPSVSTKQSYD